MLKANKFLDKEKKIDSGQGIKNKHFCRYLCQSSSPYQFVMYKNTNNTSSWKCANV